MRKVGGSSSSRRSAAGSSYSSRGTASLRHLPNGVFIQLEAPYNVAFQEEFKKSIISKKRMWDANDKSWYVVKDQFDKLCHLLDKFYDEVLLLDFPKNEVAEDAWSKLWLLPGAPLEVVRATYKALAMLYHPDRGGDDAVMKLINGAYKEILGELVNGDT
uniref:Chaperone n=1 Tax=viral metagenome TaxID=1070528 RepID=A0A6M3K3A3_9ZZZZ